MSIHKRNLKTDTELGTVKSRKTYITKKRRNLSDDAKCRRRSSCTRLIRFYHRIILVIFTKKSLPPESGTLLDRSEYRGNKMLSSISTVVSFCRYQWLHNTVHSYGTEAQSVGTQCKLLPQMVLWPCYVIVSSGFGRLEVACWPFVPKFAGPNPAEAVGFFRAKKSSTRLPLERK